MTQLQDLSTALAGLVASSAPSVIAVQSHRLRSSGFVWRPGLIVTADEALSPMSLAARSFLTCGSGWLPAPGAAGFPCLIHSHMLRHSTGKNWPMTAGHRASSTTSTSVDRPDCNTGAGAGWI